MKMLVPASLLLFVVAGCQNQQAQQLNPFNAYGAQRLPPPGTQSFGQAATTQPYYPGPAANQSPSLNGGAYPGGAYQGQPPTQLAPPPANATPMNGYQGGWHGASSTSPSVSGSGNIAQASYTEEVSDTTRSTSSEPAPTTSSGSPPTITGDSTSSSSNPYLNGMRVNEVSQTAEPLAPPPTATLPSDGWGAPAPLPSASAPIQAIPKPSRIP